jgi:glycosyltransferase involved in cell wall biosynthesis
MVPRSLRGAARVVVPSAFVRGTVLEATGLPAERVVVVPHGVAPVAAGDGATATDELVRRHRLDGPVVLYPAITYPHKDHATLVAAFAKARERHPSAVLVLTGRADQAETAVAEQIAALGIGDAVRRVGRVPAADLAGLYDLAAVVAVPSRYEGFGLPAVEAMAHGRAVLASGVTALPEVVGDAGVLLPPGDVEAWAAALDRLLGDPAERHRLGAAARVRARRFEPSTNAAALAEAYRAALGR